MNPLIDSRLAFEFLERIVADAGKGTTGRTIRPWVLTHDTLIFNPGMARHPFLNPYWKVRIKFGTHDADQGVGKEIEKPLINGLAIIQCWLRLVHDILSVAPAYHHAQWCDSRQDEVNHWVDPFNGIAHISEKGVVRIDIEPFDSMELKLLSPDPTSAHDPRWLNGASPQVINDAVKFTIVRSLQQLLDVYRMLILRPAQAIEEALQWG